MEADLTTQLKTLCPHVFPDVAPSGTAAPYITYQHIGGQPLQWLDGTAADKRHTLMQINVWAPTRLAALALARQVDALISSVSTMPFMAQPENEPTGVVETDLAAPLYGCMQDFRIISAR